MCQNAIEAENHIYRNTQRRERGNSKTLLNTQEREKGG